MRILMINQVFWPDVAATAQHAHDLGKHLVAHGHEVHAIASRAIYGKKGGALPARETKDGVHIHRVARSFFGKAGIAGRAADFGLFYAAAALKALVVPRPDVVICFTTPPFISALGHVLRAVRGCRSVYWVMDLYPDVAVACGVMQGSSPVVRMLERVNRWCLRRADRAVVLGRCMEERVRAKGVDHGQVVRIGVWSDQSEIAPIARETNPYRVEWGLGDRFVVMYSGNFGLGHDVDTMLSAAERLKDDDGIRFAFVGGGKKKEIVDAFVRERGLANVVLAGYQPRERLDASLSCADAHLVSIQEGVEGCVVPCKLFGVMAAARPTIYIGHPSSEVARVLDERGCGVLVRQGDVDGLEAAIRKMAADRAGTSAMGDRARVALAETYNREMACEQWRVLLEQVVAEKGRRASRGASGSVPAASEARS
jgi:glycosyltransferase involved in cell wall biosynthesis